MMKATTFTDSSFSAAFDSCFQILTFDYSQTKQKLQMAEDDKRQQYDLKDMKTPEEVAKIIEV